MNKPPYTMIFPTLSTSEWAIIRLAIRVAFAMALGLPPVADSIYFRLQLCHEVAGLLGVPSLPHRSPQPIAYCSSIRKSAAR